MKTKTTKTPLWWLSSPSSRAVLSALRLRASSRASRKHSTVLFRNLAIVAAKTRKTVYGLQFTVYADGTMFFKVFSSAAFCVSPGEPMDGLFFCARTCSQAQKSEAAMKAIGRRKEQRGSFRFLSTSETWNVYLSSLSLSRAITYVVSKNTGFASLKNVERICLYCFCKNLECVHMASVFV